VGPRFVHGAVTLQFDSFKPYAFVSEAIWPDSDNYESAIRHAVEEVLLEHLGHLSNTRVVLKGIIYHECDSCEMGYHVAARLAALAAFEV